MSLCIRYCWILFAVAVAGCSAETKEAVYPVRGQVLLDGRPLAEACVVLHRRDSTGRSLTARTDAEGRFELTTLAPGDGAPVGQYAATVEYRERVQEGDESMRTGRNLLPARYADPATSGLPCDVRAGDNIWAAWQLSSR